MTRVSETGTCINTSLINCSSKNDLKPIEPRKLDMFSELLFILDPVFRGAIEAQLLRLKVYYVFPVHLA